MVASHRCGIAFAAVAFTGLQVLAGIAVASAEPSDGVLADTSVPEGDQSWSDAVPAATEPNGAASEACAKFGAALNLAASQYEEFAYAIAGSGNSVNYQDPLVIDANSNGRTALRAAAATALDASRTPGLPPQVSDPMQTWSVHATKLLVMMGLRAGGDSLDASANDLNDDAQNVQMACALNGGRA
jgi:hypothetical protein